MKTVFFTLFLVLFTTAVTWSQAFQVGTNMANLGLTIGGDLDGLNEGSVGLGASYDRGLWQIAGPGVISLGGYVGTTGGSYNSYRSDYYAEKWRYLIVGLRSAYHYTGFTKIPKLDVYGGAMLSYNIVNYTYADRNGKRHRGDSDFFGNGLTASLYMGGRWLFNDKLAAFMEAGYGVSSARVGVTFKM